MGSSVFHTKSPSVSSSFLNRGWLGETRLRVLKGAWSLRYPLRTLNGVPSLPGGLLGGFVVILLIA